MWLSYLQLDAAAGDLDYDLAVSVGPADEPSITDAGVGPASAVPVRPPAPGDAAGGRSSPVSARPPSLLGRSDDPGPPRASRVHVVSCGLAGRRRDRRRGGVVTAGGYVLAAPRPTPPLDALGPEPVTVVVDVEHSRFVPADLVVEVGTEVRFVVRNGDPIGHELIVGPPDVHERHRHGTEPAPRAAGRRALRRSGRAGRHELRLRRAAAPSRWRATCRVTTSSGCTARSRSSTVERSPARLDNVRARPLAVPAQRRRVPPAVGEDGAVDAVRPAPPLTTSPSSSPTSSASPRPHGVTAPARVSRRVKAE